MTKFGYALKLLDHYDESDLATIGRGSISHPESGDASWATTCEPFIRDAGLRERKAPQDSRCRACGPRPLLAGLDEGHHPIRTAKRDCLVMLDDEPCPGNQRVEAAIQV